MAAILHILTRPDDAEARALIDAQRRAGEAAEVFDLTTGGPDYAALLEKIFAAESVETW